MPGQTDYSSGLYHWNGASIFADTKWVPESYEFDASTLQADTYGIKRLYPGSLVVLNTTTKRLNPATQAQAAAEAGTYQIWPVGGHYNLTIGNQWVEVVLGGVLVEKYCAGFVVDGEPQYTDIAIPAAVKAALPAVIWR